MMSAEWVSFTDKQECFPGTMLNVSKKPHDILNSCFLKYLFDHASLNLLRVLSINKYFICDIWKGRKLMCLLFFIEKNCSTMNTDKFTSVTLQSTFHALNMSHYREIYTFLNKLHLLNFKRHLNVCYQNFSFAAGC